MRELLVIQYRNEKDAFKRELIKQKGLAIKKLIEQQSQDENMLQEAVKALL